MLATLHRVSLCLLLCLLWASARAQEAPTLSGRVTDAQGAPLPFASLVLLSTDSTRLGGTVSNEQGTFSLKLSPQAQSEPRLVLRATALGYQPQRKTVLRGQYSGIALSLPAEVVQTKAVELTATKKVIEQEAGKTIVNVENSIATNGLTALDVLRRAPGVTVDNSGNVSMKGRSNVLVLIDNKPTQLQPSELAALLESLNADQLGTIELITNPSAAYDAQGTGGIINLNLRRNRRRGWGGNTNLTAGTGIYAKANGSVGGYLATEKWNLTANYSGRLINMFDRYEQNRTYPQGEIPNLRSIMRTRKEGYISNARVQADYQATPNTQVSLGFGTFGRNEEHRNDNISSSFLQGREVERTESDGRTNSDLLNFNTRLGFNSKLTPNDSTLSKHTLIGYVDGSTFRMGSTNDLDTRFARGSDLVFDSSWVLRSDLPVNNRVLVGQLDYVRMPKRGFGLEAGTKLTYVAIASQPDIRATDQLNRPVPNVNQQQDYHYNEQIQAGYAVVHYKAGRLGLQAGLRTEWWTAEGEQRLTDARFTRDQWFVLPSFGAEWQLDSIQSLAFSYGTRIDRPSYRLLNPLPFYGDPYTIFAGNPQLRPQVADNLELSHSLFSGTLITTINYNQTRRLIAEYTLSRPEPGQAVQTLTPQNIARRTNYGISLGYNPQLGNWLQAQLFAQALRTRVDGDYQGYLLNNQMWVLISNASVQARLNKRWRAEANAWRVSRNPESVGIQLPMWALGLAVQRQLTDRANLKLAVEDLFYRGIYRARTNLGTVVTNNKYQWDGRQVLLTFSYQFNKGLANRSRVPQTPADQRLGGNG